MRGENESKKIVFCSFGVGTVVLVVSHNTNKESEYKCRDFVATAVLYVQTNSWVDFLLLHYRQQCQDLKSHREASAWQTAKEACFQSAPSVNS